MSSLQGYTGRSLQGFTRSLQGFSSLSGLRFVVSYNSESAVDRFDGLFNLIDSFELTPNTQSPDAIAVYENELYIIGISIDDKVNVHNYSGTKDRDWIVSASGLS